MSPLSKTFLKISFALSLWYFCVVLMNASFDIFRTLHRFSKMLEFWSTNFCVGIPASFAASAFFCAFSSVPVR